jgi:putative hemolysin
VLVVLGRIPEKPGDVVEVSGWRIEVLDVEHHAITQVRLRSQPKPRNDQGL